MSKIHTRYLSTSFSWFTQARPILGKVIDGGSFEELVDPNLGDKYDPSEMMRMVACGAACIRHSARRRPKMSQVHFNRT